jgi:hypothetical protein
VHPDLIFWLALAAKMAVTAAFVVGAARTAERLGSVVGGLVAALPISAGPAYVFLSFDHDAAFIAQSALNSLAINAAAVAFSVSYIVLAQSRSTAISLIGALAPWFITTAIVQRIGWGLAGAMALNAAAFVIGLPIARRFQSATLRPALPQWYDMPVRAGLVATLVATVVIASRHVGPAATGTLAVFPVALSSLIVIFQPRIGGPATAALIANTLSGLIGFALALLVLNLTAVSLGTAVALLLALSTSVSWNLMLWLVWRQQRV